MNAVAESLPVKRAEDFAVARQAVVKLMADMSVPVGGAARMLGFAESTLRRWCRQIRQWCAGQVMRLWGRPRLPIDPWIRNDVIHAMHGCAGRATVKQLKKAFPQVARSELEKIARRFKRIIRKRKRRSLHHLHWQNAGTVWAMDFSQVKGQIEGQCGYFLCVRDLASGSCLASVAVDTQDAATVVGILESLFVCYGAPLAIKADNGSGFLAQDTKDLTKKHGVLMLFSPPGLPSYNGACEAGVGSIKHRAQEMALMHGRPGKMTLDDLEAARLQANAVVLREREYEWTRQEKWNAREKICPVRRQELQTCYARWHVRLRMEQGIALDVQLPHAEQASLDRIAIREALCENDLLLIRRRD